MSMDGQSRNSCSSVWACAAGIRETVTNGSCVVRFWTEDLFSEVIVTRFSVSCARRVKTASKLAARTMRCRMTGR